MLPVPGAPRVFKIKWGVLKGPPRLGLLFKNQSVTYMLVDPNSAGFILELV